MNALTCMMYASSLLYLFFFPSPLPLCQQDGRSNPNPKDEFN